MSGFDYVRDYYGVPARRGARVEYSGGRVPQLGTITAPAGHRIRIRLDGEEDSGWYHPTWAIRYLDAPRPDLEGNDLNG